MDTLILFYQGKGTFIATIALFFIFEELHHSSFDSYKYKHMHISIYVCKVCLKRFVYEERINDPSFNISFRESLVDPKRCCNL